MCDVICKTVLCVINLFFTNLKREKNLFQIEDFHTTHCMNNNLFVHSIYKKKVFINVFSVLRRIAEQILGRIQLVHRIFPFNRTFF